MRERMLTRRHVVDGTYDDALQLPFDGENGLSMAEATLVTSRLTGSRAHAPALDVDLPVELLTDRAGRPWLQLPEPLPADRRGELAWRFTGRTRRTGTAGVPPDLLFHDVAMAATVVTMEALADTYTAGGFAALHRDARALTPDPGPAVPVEADPATLLALPATTLVIPSSTGGHRHVYVDRTMSWAAYRRLLETLCDVGLLEHGYVSASFARDCTRLRRPGFYKTGSGRTATAAQPVAF